MIIWFLWLFNFANLSATWNSWCLFAAEYRCYVVVVQDKYFSPWLLLPCGYHRLGANVFSSHIRAWNKLALAKWFLIDVPPDTQAWLSLPVNLVLLFSADVLSWVFCYCHMCLACYLLVLYMLFTCSRHLAEFTWCVVWTAGRVVAGCFSSFNSCC